MSEEFASFDDRLASCVARLSPSEQRVAQMFGQNREEVLFSSAMALAAKVGTSDATVVRTARALGFSGMEEMRRSLASEMKDRSSQMSRLAATLEEVGGDVVSAFAITLDIHIESLARLRSDVTPELFGRAVELIGGARRTMVFGLGPSSAMADYFAIQLGRFSLDAAVLSRTGILAADDLHRLKDGDALVVLAYGRTYPELDALLVEADRLGLARMLLTDRPGPDLRGRFDLVLPVARGRADMFSMHTATLGLLEALLVGIAATRPEDTLRSLRSLNALREKLAGRPMDLPTPDGPRDS